MIQPMTKARLAVLVKQSKFNKDIPKIIDLIAPVVCGKKITKREIDKANKILLDHFGVYTTYKDIHEVEKVMGFYQVSLRKDYINRLAIWANDRSVSGEYTGYIPESDKTIYLEDGGKISVEELNKYKPSRSKMPTAKQIEKAYIKYQELGEKISKLKDKQSDLSFYY
jgi:hypothetical protein